MRLAIVFAVNPFESQRRWKRRQRLSAMTPSIRRTATRKKASVVNIAATSPRQISHAAMIRYPPIWGVIRRTSPTCRAAAAEGMRQAAYDFLRRYRRWAELLNHVARNGKQPGPGPQMAFARPSSSNKRRFHVEVDHHGSGVLPRAITIQMPKPPQAGHQIPSS